MKQTRLSRKTEPVDGLGPDQIEAADRERIERHRDDLAFLRGRLGRFDFEQRASGVAALQLMPENSPFTARLELADVLVASLTPRPGPAPDWGWLNSTALGPAGGIADELVPTGPCDRHRDWQ